MSIGTDLITKELKKLKKTNFSDIILRSVKNNETLVLNYNTEDQLYVDGIDHDSDKLLGYASVTKFLKKLKGQPTNRTTLRDTGDFHRSFKIKFGSDEFEIYATDSKSDELALKYGDDIFGLTDENLQDLIDNYIYDDLIKFTRLRLGV